MRTRTDPSDGGRRGVLDGARRRVERALMLSDAADAVASAAEATLAHPGDPSAAAALTAALARYQSSQLAPVVTEEWARYRRDILALVGDEDPAAVQAATGAALDERVRRAVTAGVERVRPADGEWSVVELLGHLLDGEIFSSARYRWILAEDRPRLDGYDQDAVARVSNHGSADPELLLAAWRGLRAANLALWAQSTEAMRSREGVHAERGPSSFRVLFTELAGHDRFHLAQIDATLATVLA